MARIFLSYRRAGASTGYAHSLARSLQEVFGDEQLFRDIDDIETGVDFVAEIDRAVATCDVLIAVLGEDWLTLTDDAGQRRLNDPNDFVRLEIGAALERDIRVVPVLVGGASMPSAEALPDDIKPLARRQAHELSDRRWDYDVQELIAALKGAGIQPIKRDRSEKKWLKRVGPVAAVLAAAALLYGQSDELGQLVQRFVGDVAPPDTMRDASSVGALVVESEPPDAHVWLDGTEVGVTGDEHLHLRDLSPGEHVLRLTRSGYHDWEQRFRLESGDDRRFEVELEPVESSPLAAFMGGWVNQDANTRGITRLRIRRQGPGVKVHAWGKCHPQDCDWGEESALVENDVLNVTWDQGFALRRMVIERVGSKGLQMRLRTLYSDNRSPRTSTEYFRRP